MLGLKSNHVSKGKILSVMRKNVIYLHIRKFKYIFGICQNKFNTMRVNSLWLDDAYIYICVSELGHCLFSTKPLSEPGPCLTTAIWRCHKNSSQWQRSFQWKLHSHWLKFLWQHHVAVVRQGPVLPYYQLHPWDCISVISYVKLKSFHRRKCIWTCCLQNCSYFVRASMC